MLTGRVAVITGAGRGIGAAAAKIFAREGAKVVVNDLNIEPATEVVDEIKAAGGSALAIAGSVTDEALPDQLMDAAMGEYGKIDVLVNNAGFTWDGMVHKMSDKQWQMIVDCHATAPFRMIRAAAPYMRDVAKQEKQTTGTTEDRCIINVSSTSGLHGNFGQANYAFCKMGVVGLTKTVAKEWGAFGVRCNAVAFGMISTRMTSSFGDGEAIVVDGQKVPQGMPANVADAWDTDELLQQNVPLGRKGLVDEAAGGMLMLASPYASYVTGHTLEVTGGMGI